MLNINIFLKYSIYIGHSALNSLVLSSWFFFKLKKKIWIINLFKTILFLKLVFKFLKYLVLNNLPFWFVTLDLEKEYIFKKYALICGEFSCTRLWIRGFLSNFKSIQKSINKFFIKKYTLKPGDKQNLVNDWVMTRFTWPRGIFLSNLPLNYIICKEAGNMQLPVVAMVDTNIKSYLFTYPLPSNDDATDSVCFVISLLSNKILLLKYYKVVSWYNKYNESKKKFKNMMKNLGFKKIKQKVFSKIGAGSKRFYLSTKKLIKVKQFKSFFYSKFLRSKHLKRLLISKLFNNFLKFKNNMQDITNPLMIKDKGGAIIAASFIENVSKSKFRAIKKITNNNIFFSNFVKKYTTGVNFKTGALGVLSNTIRLKYLGLRFKKNKKYNKSKSLKKFYFNYFVMSKYIRNIRTFHESFFVNKASNFKFISFYQKYYGHHGSGYNNRHLYDKRYNKNKKWYYYNGFRVQYNDKRKKRWLTNYFNKQFYKNEKLNKTSYFSDAAIILNTNRFVTPHKRFSIMRKNKRTVLKYWLFPFISKFTIKDDFQWYHPRFFHKEDNVFRTHFKWKVTKQLTPQSTLHFYNNWFMYLFKNKKKYKYNKKLDLKKLNKINSKGSYKIKIKINNKNKNKNKSRS